MVAVVLPTPTLPPRATGPARPASPRRPGSVAAGRHLRRRTPVAPRAASRPVASTSSVRRRWTVVVAVVVGIGGLVALALLPAIDLTASRSVGTHVVADGETVWSIATALAPAGDAPRYAERLIELNGSSTVAAGQVLELPAP